jgi:hypothetical protein
MRLIFELLMPVHKVYYSSTEARILHLRWCTCVHALVRLETLSGGRLLGPTSFANLIAESMLEMNWIKGFKRSDALVSSLSSCVAKLEKITGFVSSAYEDH